MKQQLHRNEEQVKIVVIGGGTGSFTLLSALKRHVEDLTALVNMADDGGSTGVLRDELGVLPPGDIRQCLVALSNSSQALRELFNYRFPEGMLAGHSFGNIFLSAVEKMTNDFNEAVMLASQVLQITGRVLPITLDNCHLVLRQDGKETVGEYVVANTELPPGSRPELFLRPAARLNPKADKAIRTAGMIVIAPGNLYGSLAPALLVDGVKEALQATRAKVAYVCNLVNKPHQTRDYAVHDYADEIERFAGPGVLDYVLYNEDIPSAAILDAYALEDEYPVAVDRAALSAASYEAVPGRFLSHTEVAPNMNDTFILRSLIRHDGEAISHVLRNLYHA